MTDHDREGLERGRLETIWVKRVRRGPMDERRRARLIAGKGLEDDANLGMKRQVTILSREQWEDVGRALGRDVDPTVRRANLMVSGIDLRESRGRVLLIGGCRVYVNGETRPCRSVDEVSPGLREALDPEWRGGVYGEVLAGGEIAVGDPVAWEEP